MSTPLWKFLPRWLALTAFTLLPGGPRAADLPAPLERKVAYEEIAPLFEASCYSCHGAERQRADYRLDLGDAALHGGNHGPNIIPGKSAESRLVQLIGGLVEDELMPPKGERLSSEQIAAIRAWIDQGADWPGAKREREIELTWSLKPLEKTDPPVVPGNASSNPIDAFILAKLAAVGLSPSPEADRKTLIRRLSFDLTGFPPTLAQVRDFVNDPDPRAYDKLVERLLASPQYGERWARHWLDVVHYGDTHGYDKDQPRPNAWPYRDYVIRSLNEDKPYSRFVREQLAGDVLYPGNAEAIEALGFISAGPWDQIGHTEVPESKIDGKIARHLDRDDMVSATMSTFTSLTVHCAQCHNHKFDPIPMEEYYKLQAVFAAVDRADKEYFRDPEQMENWIQARAEQREARDRKRSVESEIAKAGGDELASARKLLAAATQRTKGGVSPEFGYHSAIEASPTEMKWVQVDLGEVRQISKLVLVACSDDFAGIGDGFGFPKRFKVEASNDPEFQSAALLVDETGKIFTNPGITPQSREFPETEARYVRVTATELATRQNDYVFALAELEIYDLTGNNVALGGAVTSLDSIEAPVRWARQNLVDGRYPGKGADSSPDEVERLQKELEEIRARLVNAELRAAEIQAAAELERIDTIVAALPRPNLVFAGTIHNGGGAFRGTGPDGGKPRPIHLLARGDVRKPGSEVSPGALSLFADLPGDFDLSESHSEGERRAALARWITDERNPLTWRSIVNRVWQYHFGRALAGTPNDFGKMGLAPTHPELLDWLAAEFRDGGQSFKGLHRLIVTSSTYKQVSQELSEQLHAAGMDRDNTLLWRMNRRKLEAEGVRDTALLVSGALNGMMHGPAFQDFIVEKPEHSPHYQYHLHDHDDPRSHRRSIYRFIVRSQPQPFMAALDCADPSMLVEKRNESVSPAQALTLLNSGFMVTMAKKFAESLEKEAPDLEQQISLGWERALSREPSPGEKAELLAHASEHGLANACRLIFNLNEFIFVD